MPKRKKTIIDCNIIISAGLNEGKCREVIAKILRHHENHISKEILEEYREVINRKKFVPCKTRLIDMVEIICERSVLVNIDNIECDFSLPDLKDEIYVRTGIEGDCNFLITGNMKDFPKLKYKNLRIISPSDFLKL